MFCIKSESFPIGRNNPNNTLINDPRMGKDAQFIWNSPFIPVQIRGADGTWVPVKMIMDTGASITVLTKETGDALGFKPSMGTPMPVAGVGSNSMMTMMKADIKIGRLAPVNVDVALSPGGTIANLLGVEDLLTSGRFEMKINNSRVILYDRQAADCDVLLTTSPDVRQETVEDEEENGATLAAILRGFSVGSDNTDYYFEYDYY